MRTGATLLASIATVGLCSVAFWLVVGSIQTKRGSTSNNTVRKIPVHRSESPMCLGRGKGGSGKGRAGPKGSARPGRLGDTRVDLAHPRGDEGPRGRAWVEIGGRG